MDLDLELIEDWAKSTTTKDNIYNIRGKLYQYSLEERKFVPISN